MTEQTFDAPHRSIVERFGGQAMSEAVNRAVIAGVRITVGLMWLANLHWKVPPHFGEDTGGGLYKYTASVSRHSPFAPFTWVVEQVILPNFQLFGWITLLTELLLAMLLLAGYRTRWVALAGAAMSVPILLSTVYYDRADEWSWSYFMMIALHLILFATDAGKAHGLDGVLADPDPRRAERAIRVAGVVALVVGVIGLWVARDVGFAGSKVALLGSDAGFVGDDGKLVRRWELKMMWFNPMWALLTVVCRGCAAGEREAATVGVGFGWRVRTDGIGRADHADLRLRAQRRVAPGDQHRLECGGVGRVRTRRRTAGAATGVTPGWLRPVEYLAVAAGVASAVAPAWPSRRRSRPWDPRDVLMRLAEVVAFVLAAWLVEWSVRHGRELQRDAPEVFLGAAPLVGRDFRDGWDWRFGWSLVGASVLAVAVSVSVAIDWWSRWSRRAVIAVAASAAAAFGVLLALVDGRDGLTYGAGHDTEYLANLDRMPGSHEFLRTFVQRIGDYTVHQRGHPPGFVLLLRGLDTIGLGGVWPVVVLTVISTAVLVTCVLVTLQRLAGEVWMRRAAPAMVVAPWLIWMLTSGDAVFTAVAAAAVALLAVALTATTTRSLHTDAIAFAGGLSFGALLFLTYGAVTFVIVPLAVIGLVAWRSHGDDRRRAVRTVAIAAGGTLLVVVGFALAGFWWLDGAHATRREYWQGSAQFRTFDYFGRGNLAVALIALGPLTILGLFRLRSWPMWAVVGGGLAALLASHLSQYTRGEVERIWLLFFPWIAVAGGAALTAPGRRRWWGAVAVLAQAAGAIGLQAALVSKW